MTATEFTPLQSLAGGMLIGLAATLLMLLHGRIAGITGILAGVLPPQLAQDWPWRAAFVLGMISAPALYLLLFHAQPRIDIAGSPLLLLLSGGVVGVGVTFAGGCTSGHGICGLARFSPRSAVATAFFMLATAVTVFVTRHLLGG